MAQIYKLFNINTLKNTIVIFEKHVRVSEKSRTCFSGNTYVFFRDHTIGYKSVHEPIQQASLIIRPENECLDAVLVLVNKT